MTLAVKISTGQTEGAFCLNIGDRLRQIRESSGLTQRELAARAGMTNGAISMIEQSKTSPSVSSLKSILDGIPMSLSEFFASVEAEAAPKYFFRAAEFTELLPSDLGLGHGAEQLSLRQVGDASRHSLQMLHETYPPGSETGPEMYAHESEEAGVVISGAIEITVNDQVQVLGPGDGYLFDSRLPHKFRNVGNSNCVIVSACTPPTF